jgi:hypothetical protein
MYKCGPKKYKCKCRLLEHKIGDACVKLYRYMLPLFMKLYHVFWSL